MAQSASSYIEFSTMSGFILETVLGSITNCLRTAGKYNGKVFGGFVRDVVVPRLANSSCDVKFKDVDVWFSTQTDADNFVKEMGSSFVEGPFAFNAVAPVTPGVNYPFTRKQYHLYQHGTCVGWIDVIVSSTIPVNDFNVNRLTYLYSPGNNPPKAESFGDESSSTLIESIRNKRATMLPGYINILTGPQQTSEPHLRRIQRIFLDKGWNISCLMQVPTNLTFTWIRQNLRAIPIPSAPVLTPNPATSPSSVVPNDPNPSNASSIPSACPSSTPMSESTSCPVLASTSDPANVVPPAKSSNPNRDEALAAFNMGMEAMRIAFLKLSTTK